jgi:hypothetical protein
MNSYGQLRHRTRPPLYWLVLLLVLLLSIGCYEVRESDDDDSADEDLGDDDSAGDDDTGDDDDTGADDDTGDDDDATPDDGPLGFIGSPCLSDAECDFDGGTCLLEDDGFPGGACSVACDLYCPDLAGHPTTFCVEEAALLPAAADLGDGACFSRCDMGLFPGSGCRPGYGCRVEARANEASTEMYVCMPGEESDLSSCHIELAERGIDFEPTVRADASPDGFPNLICHIEEPVWVKSPVLGTELRYYDGSITEKVLASCDMAHSLADTVLDVQPLGVSDLLHIGTYNCRVISGTSTLSRHGYGDAIDIYGFRFDDGTEWTLVDHWEGGPDDIPAVTPVTPAGIFLNDAAYRWHDEDYWSIILTPNYNDAHDNHFHVDLTPGSDFIGLWGGTWIGPAPYND